MSRRKKAEFKDPLRIKEVCLKYGVDPFEEMVKIAQEVVRIPSDVDKKTLEAIRRDYKHRYELVMDESGQEVFRTRQDIRLKVWSEACRYCYPQLKATENKVESDFRVNVVVKQFEITAPQKPIVIVEAARSVLPEKVAEAIVEQENSDDA